MGWRFRTTSTRASVREIVSGALVQGVDLLSRISSFGSGATAAPTGRRAYAIGDVHGRLDLLDDLLKRIEADNASRPHARVTMIFLGDLIDRGPQSAQVVERLRRYRPKFVNGEPVETHGVIAREVFKMRKQNDDDQEESRS